MAWRSGSATRSLSPTSRSQCSKASSLQSWARRVGCGKTTTLRMIAGLDKPTAGEIRLWGRRLNDDEPWERDTPLVWQSYALFPFLSVRKNVEFGLKQRGLPAAARRAKADEWLARLG